MYILGMVILVFFAVIGIAALAGALIRAQLISDTDGFILLIPQVDEATAEARIRSAVMMAQAQRGCRIVCVCREGSSARELCSRMQREYPQVEIIDG